MITVTFPLAGIFRLLHWHEQDKGHHIIVAQSHQAVVQAFQVVLREEPDAKVKDYWKVEMVAPTAEMHKHYDDLVEAAELRLFEQMALSEAQRLVRFDKIKLEELPYMKRCPGVATPNEGHDDHMWCEEFDCTSGMVLNVPDKMAFLRDRKDAYNKGDVRGHRLPSGVPSRARAYSRDQKVYQAKLDRFQYGVSLAAFDKKCVGYASSYECLFFFHKLHSMSTKEFKALTAALDKKQKVEQISAGEMLRREQAKRDQESLARVLRALGP